MYVCWKIWDASQQNAPTAASLSSLRLLVVSRATNRYHRNSRSGLWFMNIKNPGHEWQYSQFLSKRFWSTHHRIQCATLYMTWQAKNVRSLGDTARLLALAILYNCKFTVNTNTLYPNGERIGIRTWTKQNLCCPPLLLYLLHWS